MVCGTKPTFLLQPSLTQHVLSGVAAKVVGAANRLATVCRRNHICFQVGELQMHLANSDQFHLGDIR